MDAAPIFNGHVIQANVCTERKNSESRFVEHCFRWNINHLLRPNMNVLYNNTLHTPLRTDDIFPV